MIMTHFKKSGLSEENLWAYAPQSKDSRSGGSITTDWNLLGAVAK